MALAIMAAMGLRPTGAGAYVLHGVEWRPDDFPVQYYIDADTYPLANFTGETAGDITNAIISAFDQWAAASGLSFLRSFADPGDPGYVGSHSVRVSFADLGGPGGDMGLTTRSWVDSYYIGNKIEFDDQETNWSLSDKDGVQIDFVSIALRQIGFAIGLNHSPEETAVMYPFLDPDDFSKNTLQPDDIAGVQQLYGEPTTGTPLPGPVWIMLMGAAWMIASSAKKGKMPGFRS